MGLVLIKTKLRLDKANYHNEYEFEIGFDRMSVCFIFVFLIYHISYTCIYSLNDKWSEHNVTSHKIFIEWSEHDIETKNQNTLSILYYLKD